MSLCAVTHTRGAACLPVKASGLSLGWHSDRHRWYAAELKENDWLSSVRMAAECASLLCMGQIIYMMGSAVLQENPLVYLDLSLGRYGDATPLGRVVIELKEDAVPKTAQNFKQLAESQQAGSGYLGSRAHRIIPGEPSGRLRLPAAHIDSIHAPVLQAAGQASSGCRGLQGA